MSFSNSVSQIFQLRVSKSLALPLILLFSFLIGILTTTVNAQQVDVWVGTAKDDGIFHLKLNTNNGKLTQPKSAAKISGSGFLAMHPTEKVLYSTERVGAKLGIGAFSIGMKKVNPVVAKPIARKPVAAKPVASPELVAAQMRLKELGAIFGPDHPSMIAAVRRVQELKKIAPKTQAKAPVKKAKKDPRPQPDNSVFGLQRLSFVETGDGGAACVGVDKTGKVAMSAQYGGGSVSTYQLRPNGSIGRLVAPVEHGLGSGVNQRRQAQSHPHWVGTSPDNNFLMVPDLGKDSVVVYKLDSESGRLEKHSEVPSPPGAGPRHMKFHGSGKYAYVLNELTLSVSVFEYDAQGAKFKKLQEIKTLPDELKDEQLHSAAEIRIHPSGKFLYTSNRGHDSITVFTIDQDSGKLEFVQRESIRGAWPRNFNIDPSGKWLLAAGRHTNTLTLFSIDEQTGKLAYARKSVNIPAPICVVFGK